MSFYLNLLATVLPISLVIGIAVYFGYRGKPTRVILLEYQRGVLYKRGFPVRDVGPGRYWVWAGTELLCHADTRPMSISPQKQAVSLQDGATAVYSFLASVQARDIRKVIYSAIHYEQIPHATIRRCVRLALNLRTGEEVRRDLEVIIQEVTREAKARLSAAGFDLLSFRITELSVVVPNAAPRNIRSVPEIIS